MTFSFNGLTIISILAGHYFENLINIQSRWCGEFAIETTLYSRESEVEASTCISPYDQKQIMYKHYTAKQAIKGHCVLNVKQFNEKF